jgi:hypothetical protein
VVLFVEVEKVKLQGNMTWMGMQEAGLGNTKLQAHGVMQALTTFGLEEDGGGEQDDGLQLVKLE